MALRLLVLSCWLLPLRLWRSRAWITVRQQQQPQPQQRLQRLQRRLRRQQQEPRRLVPIQQQREPSCHCSSASSNHDDASTTGTTNRSIIADSSSTTPISSSTSTTAASTKTPTTTTPRRSTTTSSRREWLASSSSSLGTTAATMLGTTSTACFADSSAASEATAAAVPRPSPEQRRRSDDAPFLMPEYYNDSTQPRQDASAGRSCFPALTPPFRNRATYLYETGRDCFALEQLLTFQNVTATIRCNILPLLSSSSSSNNNDGGLWVHSPLYPTGELCSLLDSLDGRVEHIVLPCNALEHKAPMQQFCNRYPHAAVWIAPGQFGPLGSCGTTNLNEKNNKMPYRVDGILGDENSPPPPWADEFHVAILYADIPGNAGPCSEVAFCHRPTNTLIATDAVVYIPNVLPENANLFTTYFDDDTITTDPTFWPRTVLQSVFLPLRGGTSAAAAGGAETTTSTTYYPGFDAIADRLIRAPILRGFVDARAPAAVREWVDTICSWKFDRILTSHFASPIAAGPKDVHRAFGYLYDEDGGVDDKSKNSFLPPIACQDWELLDSLNKVIADYKLGAPATFGYHADCRTYY